MMLIGYIVGVVFARKFSLRSAELFGVGLALSEIARSQVGAEFWRGLTGGAQ